MLVYAFQRSAHIREMSLSTINDKLLIVAGCLLIFADDFLPMHCFERRIEMSAIAGNDFRLIDTDNAMPFSCAACNINQ